ncbi:endolytic transglycosylase MltG [Tabrizicola oligotrophica]|uniref:Endolytic murein transglycosylase n=1 Tax=Tabrizicola oligotrophica TaxID=2710650 RepID=A0A6M0QPC2_9RHOB|nr:endolytic transglycosylase MltG [Tabrizicola oligotrophica]NEY89305.1 endolytic transglycosylase MltG [Tabrizicola oligotrophica]
MWRAVASNALTFFILLLIVAAGLLAWGRQAYTGPGPLVQAVCFKVERGASLSQVSRALEDQGAVSDARIFRIGAEYSDKGGLLKFGSYLIQPGSSMAEVIDQLTAGGQSTCGREVNFRISVATTDVVLRELDATTNRYVEVVKFDPAAEAVPAEYVEASTADDMRWRITVAEGVTSWQVVEGLKRADFLDGKIEGVPPEGALAPDSYEVDRGADRAALIAEMTERQARIVADLWASRAADLPYDTPEAAMVMASIVEKETGVAEERGRVASVFVNRLRQGMKLQTDPTVIYGITKGEGVLGRGLRQSELRRETPYNTYVIDGLPPGPIANPGRAAIEAALNPETTDFLYFVADGTGGHAFAATLEAHNENVAKWREIEAQQKAAEPAVEGN